MTPTNDELESARREGIVQGQLQAIEKMLASHSDRLDHHDKRLSVQEKITWGILGAFALVTAIDAIKSFVGAT